MAAADELGYTKLALAGGVAANSMLRDKLSEMASACGEQFYMPDISLCGDDAAMMGSVRDIMSIWQEIRLICR